MKAPKGLYYHQVRVTCKVPVQEQTSKGKLLLGVHYILASNLTYLLNIVGCECSVDWKGLQLFHYCLELWLNLIN